VNHLRYHAQLEGRLQGVGFRPFVFRLSQQLGLSGWVRNTGKGVELVWEGEKAALEEAEARLQADLPPPGLLRSMGFEKGESRGERSFRILPSVAAEEAEAELQPDLALCSDCLQEMRCPGNRRYRYPFTNCATCGPRYSIVEKLPFDRANTSMRDFPLCSACRFEYADPADRRFHAQTISCPACGPRLSWRNQAGEKLAEGDAVFSLAGAALQAGKILAVKGIGGFHLVCLANDGAAIRRLRELKHRARKPLAVMVADLREAERFCFLSALERERLASAEAPIVLSRRRKGAPLAAELAPGLSTVGIFLPYSPLHHLLLEAAGQALVVTSANRRGEPVLTEEGEALRSLEADFILSHNRGIQARADDSVVREIGGKECVLRAGRGYAPMEITVPECFSPPRMAAGPQEKNSIAFGRGRKIVMLPHLGSLDSINGSEALALEIQKAEKIHGLAKTAFCCDLHPAYVSTALAHELDPRPLGVQHHLAHLFSCAAEHGLNGDFLGFAWDGTGLGADGTLWGAETFLVEGKRARHVAGLRPIALPGGERAVREPRRSALALLQAVSGDLSRAGFLPGEAENLCRLLSVPGAAPSASSMGRLFDGVAALLGLCAVADFEGEAAMQLEGLVEEERNGENYPLRLLEGSPRRIDWEVWVRGLLTDLDNGLTISAIAARFHRSLVLAIREIALTERERGGPGVVVLSGGCFQNRILSEWAEALLKEAGFAVLLHSRVPPNDGGIAVGQVWGGSYVLVGSG
jgi:hydrogenase maturation protein HypF